MSNKNNKKENELLENKCTCNEEVCDCKNKEIIDDKSSCDKNVCDCNNIELEDEESFDDLMNDFTGSYTVSFDGLCDEDESLEYELDTKKLALVGLGALLAGGAICYAIKKKKKKK